MLVLTRRVGESIVVDGNIYVTVISVAGNKIRLGISAPPSVTVDREEIMKRKLNGIPTTALPELAIH